MSEKTTSPVTETSASQIYSQNKNHLYKNLISPLQVGTQTIRNRMVMGSMHTGLEDKFLSLNDLAAFYEERAKGGVGLIITGGFAPNWRGWLLPFASTFNNSLQILKHKTVTERVHKHGAKIALQILHAGRYAYHPFSVAPSSIKSAINPFKPKEMSEAKIYSTIKDFANTARLAQKAGYDGVEIMGSEGYLINEFVSLRTNKRTDKWGGSLENRMRFPIEIVKAVRKAVGNDFLIIYRLSMLELVENGNSVHDNIQIAKSIESAGASIIGTGIGWHEARVPTIATDVPRAAFTWVTAEIKKHIRIPIITSNRINTPDMAEKILSDNQSDLISMARPWLADPYFGKKTLNQQPEKINSCIGCNQACLDHIFMNKRASCLVNPKACYENEYKIINTTEPKKIAVVGAGPSGLSAATTLAERGHTVFLFDENSEIGGQFNLAKQVPGKIEFAETIRYFKSLIFELKINLRLQQKISAKQLKEEKFDHVIIATGIKPRVPNIEGINKTFSNLKVISYIQLLKKQISIGKKVAVIGAGGIGFDVSKFLLHQMQHPEMDSFSPPNLQEFEKEWGIDRNLNTAGNLKKPIPYKLNENNSFQITLMQRKQESLGKNLGKTTGWIHRALLKAAGVEMLSGIEYKKISEQGLHIIHKGQEKILDVDQIVLCAGQESLNDLKQDCIQEGFDINHVHLIGGAKIALELDAKAAIKDGFELGLKI